MSKTSQIQAWFQYFWYYTKSHDTTEYSNMVYNWLSVHDWHIQSEQVWPHWRNLKINIHLFGHVFSTVSPASRCKLWLDTKQTPISEHCWWFWQINVIRVQGFSRLRLGKLAGVQRAKSEATSSKKRKEKKSHYPNITIIFHLHIIITQSLITIFYGLYDTGLWYELFLVYLW